MATVRHKWEICMEIYRRLYRESEPSVDFDALLAAKPPDDFYLTYYLDEDRQLAIIKEECAKHRLWRWEKQQIANTVLLGVSPTCVRKPEEGAGTGSLISSTISGAPTDS